MLAKTYLSLYVTNKLASGILYKTKNKGRSLELIEAKVAEKQEDLLDYLKESYSLKNCHVSAVYTYCTSFNRLLTFPNMSINQLKEAVYWEIKPFLDGYSPIHTDYGVVGELPGEPQLLQVYVSGLEIDFIAGKLMEMTKRGLIPRSIKNKWSILFSLWQQLLKRKDFQPNSSILLYLDGDEMGELLICDQQQGYTVRQISVIQPKENLLEELKFIIKFLQGKSTEKLTKILTLGGAKNSILEQVNAELDMSWDKISIATLISEFQWQNSSKLIGLEGEEDHQALIGSLGLIINEVNYG